MLGLTTEFNPRFVRHYANLAESMQTAVARYIDDVKQGKFPADTESYD
jgi:3-methyl-2-oxobutanoate hydroxymethyltransferase